MKSDENHPSDLFIDTSSGLEETKGEKKIDLRKTANLRTLDPIPDVEWWDAQFLPPSTSDREGPKKFPTSDITDSDIFMAKITHYIQHPKKLKNEHIEAINKLVVPLHLTDKEKKRLRRMKRLDKEKDK
jgi:hypothetical protein